MGQQQQEIQLSIPSSFSSCLGRHVWRQQGSRRDVSITWANIVWWGGRPEERAQETSSPDQGGIVLFWIVWNCFEIEWYAWCQSIGGVWGGARWALCIPRPTPERGGIKSKNSRNVGLDENFFFSSLVCFVSRTRTPDSSQKNLPPKRTMDLMETSH